MIDANAPFKSAPRISRDAFITIIRRDAASGVSAERDPGAYWDAIKATGVDPLFVLAQFSHESSLGKAGTARTTHSWGNTRAPSFGATPIGEVAGRSGMFPVFRDWLDGCKSTAARLVEPTWVYANRTRIIDIFDWPADPAKVWAPAGDLNDPAGYLRAVLDFMNAYTDQPTGGTMTEAQIAGFAWLPADADHFEAGRRAAVRGGAQHYTAGTDSRAWLTTSSQPPVSAHFLVKRNATLAERGWQLVRLEDTAWTTGAANPYTVSIEYEHRDGESIPDGDYEALAQTWVDIATAVARLGLGTVPLTRAAIKGHREWTPGTACPDGVDVDRIVARAAELASGVPPAPNPPAADPPEPMWIPEGQPNGAYAFRRGFYAHVRRVGEAVYPPDWRAGALAVFGYPLGDEYATAAGSAQVCERYVLVWQRGTPAPWDVTGTLRDEPAPPATGG